MATEGMSNGHNPPRKAKSNPILWKSGSGSSLVKNQYKVSSRVNIVGKGMSHQEIDPDYLKGAKQAKKQNVKASTPISKSEAKANARGLKAANAPKKAPKMGKK
jgi:hypothetical protein